MQLPEFLHDADGEIRFVGHRIALHHVVNLYGEGYSAEMIAATFPTLPLPLVHRVIAFYLDNQAEVDAVVAEHNRAMDRLEAETRAARATPTMEQLRQRFQQMQRPSKPS
jgi:uncharacterized protein (DUF433 family)